MVRCTFNPPEEELINYYLNNKITEKDDLDGKQINEVNICHYEPADLPGLAKIESSHTWYFISPVEKFGRLNRTKRASRSGHWKITGNSRTVKDVDGNPIGLKKFLVFQENKRSSTCSSSTTNTQQHKANWIIHEFHSFLHHPNQDAYVLCKLKKNTRTRRTAAVADASLAMIDLSLTSDPVVLNHSQVMMGNKNIVEDNGGDYCNDLEELLPEFHTTNWFDYSQFDHFLEGSFINITQPIILEGGESSGLPSGENGHVYGPNTRENSNHLGECCEVVEEVAQGMSPTRRNNQI
ncbi:NAC domain-containing protein 1 [Capsella rubella]|uniref:NAC domain-containing protein 1 n=1 Tax=Capsella rubella TaxID=81985 RepID=UPI000CD51DEC|nr:NAC domain-containing protein 1 [Capsella rubella]